MRTVSVILAVLAAMSAAEASGPENPAVPIPKEIKQDIGTARLDELDKLTFAIMEAEYGRREMEQLKAAWRQDVANIRLSKAKRPRNLFAPTKKPNVSKEVMKLKKIKEETKQTIDKVKAALSSMDLNQGWQLHYYVDFNDLTKNFTVGGIRATPHVGETPEPIVTINRINKVNKRGLRVAAGGDSLFPQRGCLPGEKPGSNPEWPCKGDWFDLGHDDVWDDFPSVESGFEDFEDDSEPGRFRKVFSTATTWGHDGYSGRAQSVYFVEHVGFGGEQAPKTEDLVEPTPAVAEAAAETEADHVLDILKPLLRFIPAATQTPSAEASTTDAEPSAAATTTTRRRLKKPAPLEDDEAPVKWADIILKNQRKAKITAEAATIPTADEPAPSSTAAATTTHENLLDQALDAEALASLVAILQDVEIPKPTRTPFQESKFPKTYWDKAPPKKASAPSFTHGQELVFGGSKPTAAPTTLRKLRMPAPLQESTSGTERTASPTPPRLFRDPRPTAASATTGTPAAQSSASPTLRLPIFAPLLRPHPLALKPAASQSTPSAPSSVTATEAATSASPTQIRLPTVSPFLLPHPLRAGPTFQRTTGTAKLSSVATPPVASASDVKDEVTSLASSASKPAPSASATTGTPLERPSASTTLMRLPTISPFLQPNPLRAGPTFQVTTSTAGVQSSASTASVASASAGKNEVISRTFHFSDGAASTTTQAPAPGTLVPVVREAAVGPPKQASDFNAPAGATATTVGPSPLSSATGAAASTTLETRTVTRTVGAEAVAAPSAEPSGRRVEKRNGGTFRGRYRLRSPFYSEVPRLEGRP